MTEVHYVMGTYLRLTVDDEARSAARPCFRQVRRLEEIFSRYDVASELSRVNAAAGDPTPVSPDFGRLLRRALDLRAATEGAFDVTIGALMALWRGPGPAPDATALAAARAGLGGAAVAGETLVLHPATRLDFDGIAKGYAVDACVAGLRAGGIERALVSLGESSLYGLGAPEGAPAWRLDVRGADPETAVGTLDLRDRAASISATYGGAGRHAGGRAHIIDPRLGRPLVEEAVGVVVAASATDAEAYSKALLVWGPAGAERIEQLGAAGAVHLGRAGVTAGAGAVRAGLFTPLPEPRPLVAAAEALR